jgi:hypothetical protein
MIFATLIAFAALVSPATAFHVGSARGTKVAAARMVKPYGDDPSAFAAGLPGSTAPLRNFDPLGFTTGKNIGEVKKLQEAELKHGRVCMLAGTMRQQYQVRAQSCTAVLGLITQETFHPLFGGDITGPAIYHWQQINVPGFSAASRLTHT